MAYWAIKRESKPLTTGIKRNSDRFEGWAVNLTLENKIVDVGIKAWDVRTSEVLYDQILLRDFTLPPNRSTEFPDFWVQKLGELQSAIVVASYLKEKSTVVARHVNFHEPLTEVPFPVSNGLTTRFVREKSRVWLELTANFPVKGVLAEMTGEPADDVFLDDNGVDLVPGEAVKLRVTGLSVGEEGKLRVRCLDRA
ncbi:hypothetical protein BKA61DRAFT_718110 [Leptodontidium sp. MPI-SDFR-AT-0119]|nr:hypothetical protein BKA61DRAFT_718110 [Leptodontidium sp. MPI-SDFR-AT-0119]